MTRRPPTLHWSRNTEEHSFALEEDRWVFATMVFAGFWLALLALLLLHHELRWTEAAACALVGGLVIPAAMLPAWCDLPPIFRRWISVAVAVGATLGVTIVTMVTMPINYWVLRWAELLLLGAVDLGTALGVGAVVLTYRRLAWEVEQRELRLAEARQETLVARMRALQAQIHPHFLFNTFNALSELIHEDPDAAEEMVEDLASLLRYSLKTSSVSLLPLREEVDAVQRYLALEKARLGKRLSLSMDIDPDVLDTPVPGLLLQPLVENAVKYAVAERVEGGSVAVTISDIDGELSMVVQDDGPGLPVELISDRDKKRGTGGHGGGFHNVRQRLELNFGERGHFITSEPGKAGARLEVRVPRG